MEEVKQKLGPRQQAWVDALRSGKYPQGVGVLKSVEGFCCLGVACDICNAPWVHDEYGYWIFENDKRYCICLSESVKDYFGFRERTGAADPSIKIGGEVYDSLIDLNDVGRLTFPEIADLVEREPYRFFVEPR